jgi:hypothetical protein
MRVTVAWLILTAALWAYSSDAAAQEGFDKLGIKIIKTQQLKSWLDQKKPDMLLINTLSPVEFRDKAIEGSINLPYEYIKENRTPLPVDKGLNLVFY